MSHLSLFGAKRTWHFALQCLLLTESGHAGHNSMTSLCVRANSGRADFTGEHLEPFFDDPLVLFEYLQGLTEYLEGIFVVAGVHTQALERPHALLLFDHTRPRLEN